MPVMQYGHMLLETSDNDSGFKYVHAVTSATGNATYQLKVVLQKGGSQTNMGTFSTALAAAVAYWCYKHEGVVPVSDVERAKTSGCGKRKR